MIIQRVDFNEEKIEKITIIGNHKDVFIIPILVQTTSDYCISSLQYNK